MTLNDGKQVSYKLLSSKDIDPEIDSVIRWHLSLCEECKRNPDKLPRGFGQPGTGFCAEYWEIFNEYSEYEYKYGMRGNP